MNPASTGRIFYLAIWIARTIRPYVSNNGLPAFIDVDMFDPNELLAPMP